MHDDYVLGNHWAEIGYGLFRLLDGETGRFDCGTFMDEVAHTLNANGYALDADHVLQYTIGYPIVDDAPEGEQHFQIVYTSAGNGFKDNRDDAVRMLGAFIGNNSPEKLAQVFHGRRPDEFKVIRVQIYRHTKDPVGTIQEDLSNV